MNLCIVASCNFFSTYGGGQVYVRNIVDEFIRRKEALDLTLSVISFDPQFPKEARKRDYHGIPVYELCPGGQLNELLTALHPDLVHANGEKAQVARLCRGLHIPCVVTAHHGGICCPGGTLLNTKDEICHIPAGYHPCLKCYLRNIRTGLCWYPVARRINPQRYIRWGQRLKKLPFIPFLSPIGEAALSVQEKMNTWSQLKDDASCFVAPSTAIAEALKRNGAAQKKVIVVPHGVPLPPPMRNKKTPADNVIRFYYVGRICHVKGIHVLLAAFSQISSSSIELHLIGGAGNKSEAQYMRTLQRKYSKDLRVHWHGKVAPSELSQLISGYDCLIHPTLCLEVFGLDIAEALVLGKHVITTRCGGAEMQIRESNHPWLVEPNDIPALLQAITWYIKEGKHCHQEFHVLSIAQHAKAMYHLLLSCLVPDSPLVLNATGKSDLGQ